MCVSGLGHRLRPIMMMGCALGAASWFIFAPFVLLRIVSPAPAPRSVIPLVIITKLFVRNTPAESSTTWPSGH